MKVFITAVILSLVVVIHCQEVPTIEQYRCIENETAVRNESIQDNCEVNDDVSGEPDSNVTVMIPPPPPPPPHTHTF